MAAARKQSTTADHARTFSRIKHATHPSCLPPAAMVFRACVAATRAVALLLRCLARFRGRLCCCLALASPTTSILLARLLLLARSSRIARGLVAHRVVGFVSHRVVGFVSRRDCGCVSSRSQQRHRQRAAHDGTRRSRGATAGEVRVRIERRGGDVKHDTSCDSARVDITHTSMNPLGELAHAQSAAGSKRGFEEGQGRFQ